MPGNHFIFTGQLEGGLAAPGMIFVGHAAMINLSAINRLVSMLDKVLRQSDDFWIQFTEVGRVLDHTDPVGSGARHQAGTGGTANGLLAVGPVKAHAVRRQFVEIRRLGDRGTIATKLRPQVVDGDEKDVRTAVGRSATAENERMAKGKPIKIFRNS